MKMGRGLGYEYSYDFWVENEIIPEYSSQLCIAREPGSKCIVFEIRTSFKLIDGETTRSTIGSERLGVAVHENSTWWLETYTAFRLEDYWMSDDEIQSLINGALDFAAAAMEETKETVGVVVGLDVCTVQQKGEDMLTAIDRAIRPERMMPLYLWYVIIPEGSMRFDETPYLDHKSFLMELPRVRVEDETSLGLMEVCPVCSRNSIIGAQISVLPCGHACCGWSIPDIPTWDTWRNPTDRQPRP